MTYAETNVAISEALGYVANLASEQQHHHGQRGQRRRARARWPSGSQCSRHSSLGPSAPISVLATGQQGQIALSWADSSGGLATSYNVLRSTTSGGPYTLVINTASTGYNDTSVSTFVPYYYVIQAVDGAGVGPYSAQVSASATGVPANPTGVVAVAYDTYVVLTWNAATGASTYNVLELDDQRQRNRHRLRSHCDDVHELVPGQRDHIL